MPVTGMYDMLLRARRRGYAVGYFEAWDQHSLEAVLEAAEQAQSPTILGFGGAVVNQSWLDSGGLEELAILARCLAERATVPAAVLFNEANTYGQVRRGLLAGCNAVMLDTSHLPFADNVDATRRVVELAHPLGACVEAELGWLADAVGPGSESFAHTDPQLAAEFVEKTGVGALGVSVGNIHGLVAGESTVDLQLLERIHAVVSVPLVIHGGTGFPSRAVRPSIQRGVAKFNVGTRLKAAFLEGLQEGLSHFPDRASVQLAVGSREDGDVLDRGKRRMTHEMIRLMELYGCAGRAERDQSEP